MAYQVKSHIGCNSVFCVEKKVFGLQEERDRSNAIVEALRQERFEVEEQQNELIRQREAQLEAEKGQREALAQQLKDTKVG